jgi:hypothetical protein
MSEQFVLVAIGRSKVVLKWIDAAMGGLARVQGQKRYTWLFGVMVSAQLVRRAGDSDGGESDGGESDGDESDGDEGDGDESDDVAAGSPGALSICNDFTENAGEAVLFHGQGIFCQVSKNAKDKRRPRRRRNRITADLGSRTSYMPMSRSRRKPETALLLISGAALLLISEAAVPISEAALLLISEAAFLLISEAAFLCDLGSRISVDLGSRLIVDLGSRITADLGSRITADLGSRITADLGSRISV